MNEQQRQKIHDTVKKIQADMQRDPALREAVKTNHIRVLADRGLDLEHIAAAHDMDWCKLGSPTTPCTPVSLA